MTEKEKKELTEKMFQEVLNLGRFANDYQKAERCAEVAESYLQSRRPTDEQIREQAKQDFEYMTDEQIFIMSAKWMRDQIFKTKEE